MTIYDDIKENIARNPKKGSQLMTSLAAFAAAGAIALGSWGYSKVGDDVAAIASNARDSFTSHLERSIENAYAPHIEAISGETVGYVELAPEPNQGLYSLMRETWDVDSENERGALERVVKDLNDLDSAAIQLGRSYVLPVDAAHASEYGLSNE